MLRIAVIMGKMHSGGKKNLVMEYYRNIDRNEIQFDFICDKDSNAIPKDEIESLGGRVYEITPYQSIFSNMRDIYRICKENKYKIMHAYNGTMNIFPMFVGFLAGVPVRINESISMAHKADKKTIIKNMLKPFSKWFSTHYMANGEECGKWQFGKRAYNRGKVEIFKTIINAELNQFYKEKRDVVRNELKLNDSFVVGHIGRLTQQKNTLFLIDIFAEILKKTPNAKLLIIGDGELKEKMIEKIKSMQLDSEVLYLGRREDIQQFYNAMDCFLLPSLYEGLPVVGVEAQCCGLPVFFSTEIPIESSACDELGFFVSLEKNAEEWATEILEKSIAVGKRKSQKEKIVRAGFDSKTQGKLLSDFYLSIVNR